MDNLIGIVSLVVAAGLATGCTAKQNDVLSAQICLRQSDDTRLLARELSIAASERGMRFINKSAQQQKEFSEIDRTLSERDPQGLKYTDPVVYMGIRGDDGISVTVANIGLNRRQVAVFVGGDRPPEARQFADDVVRKLQQHWRVDTLPLGQRLTPDASCRDPDE